MVTPEERSSWQRAGDVLGADFTDAFNKRFGLINPEAAKVFGVTPEQLRINDDIVKFYQHGQEQLDAKNSDPRRPGEAGTG